MFIGTNPIILDPGAVICTTETACVVMGIMTLGLLAGSVVLLGWVIYEGIWG